MWSYPLGCDSSPGPSGCKQQTLQKPISPVRIVPPPISRLRRTWTAVGPFYPTVCLFFLDKKKERSPQGENSSEVEVSCEEAGPGGGEDKSWKPPGSVDIFQGERRGHL